MRRAHMVCQHDEFSEDVIHKGNTEGAVKSGQFE